LTVSDIGMGSLSSRREGNGILDFLFSNISMLVFRGEMRKPWLDSQFKMRLIIDWRTLRPRCGFAACMWILRSSVNKMGLIGPEITLITSFIATKNRVPLKGEPLGIPFS